MDILDLMDELETQPPVVTMPVTTAPNASSEAHHPRPTASTDAVLLAAGIDPTTLEEIKPKTSAAERTLPLPFSARPSNARSEAPHPRHWTLRSPIAMDINDELFGFNPKNNYRFRYSIIRITPKRIEVRDRFVSDPLTYRLNRQDLETTGQTRCRGITFYVKAGSDSRYNRYYSPFPLPLSGVR